MALFQLEHESVRYDGAEVLHDISLIIETGEKIAIVGKSGAGKSTLLKRLYALRPTETAFLSQELGLVAPLSVFHNIYIGRLDRHSNWYNLLNLIKPVAREVRKVRGFATALGLEDKLFEAVGALSGGQQLRAALGRTLAQEKRIFFGDEPVAAVDELQSRRVLDQVCARHETVLLALHDLTLALDYADRIIGLRDGRIVLDQPRCDVETRDLMTLYQD